MKTRLTLRPGQNGTKKLEQKYGERLLAVRYRYDPARELRVKTVELIEERLPWVNPFPHGRDPTRQVLVRIQYEEAELRRAIKAGGGSWDAARKLWRVPLSVAHGLGLEKRIVEEPKK